MAPRPPILYCDDGEERELPARWEICGHCEGAGQSSAYLGAFTGEQMRDDPDFSEDYRRGDYDRPCEHCGGSGKVQVVDASRTPKADLDAFRRQERDSAECDRIQRQEMLAEGGWREEYDHG